MIMPKSERTDTTRRTPKKLLSALGIIVTILALEGIAIGVWLKTRPEPPKTVPMQDFNDLQTEFTAEQARLKKSQQQNTQLQTQYKSLQGKNNGLTQRLSQLISPETLPAQVRGQTNGQTLEKIQALCRATQQVNHTNVGALLAVLQEIQNNGVIYTGLDVKDEKRKALYTQIQILLKAIEVSDGPVNGQGPDTLRAVKDFQTQKQLKVDGKIGIKTFLQIVADFESTCLGNKPALPPTELAASPGTTKTRGSRPSRARR
jgi:hypothetical protein